MSALALPATARQRDTLLVIDDQAVNIQTVYRTLAADYEVLMATSGQGGIDACRRHLPSLVLLDLVMPGLSGIDVAARLKADPVTCDIPIIFVTASSDSEQESACWEAGAVDFVTKPFNPMTLRRRVQVHLSLKHQAEQLHHMAYMDGLTDIPNRRYFNQRITVEVATARRAGTPLTLVMADVDFFKRYNDHHGHLAGDACLQEVARALQRAWRRPADFVARYGGEEFAAILPGVGLADAAAMAGALRAQLHGRALPHGDSDCAAIVTASAGVVCLDRWDGAPCGADALLRQADRLLYQAKQTGRDRACVAAADPARGA
ncbi:GGDEF domain-containing response regulator [Massilia sp. DWR3-1-1]|uniref:GGDEF domain-containing response regulator n=1 Tax=Massilia sp. DWR3-1-1 TaxID=2804559 RepID=UPI003CF0D926